MNRLIVLFFLLSPFVLQAQQPVAQPPAFPVAFTVSGDTLTIDTMRFLRFRPRTRNTMRMNICTNTFCITDQAGAAKPLQVRRVRVSMEISGLLVDRVMDGGQVDPTGMDLLRGVKRGAAVYFEAFGVTNASGAWISNLSHEHLCYRRIR